MDLFTIDTVGASGSATERPKRQLLPSYGKVSKLVQVPSSSKTPVKQSVLEESNDSDEDYGGLPPPSKNISQILQHDKPVTNKRIKSKKIFEDFGSTELEQDKFSGLKKLAETDVNEQLKSAVITAATEKQESLALLSMSDRQIKELNRKERAKTKGDKWFNLPAQEMTEEVKNQLELIRMRSVLDPKHFYKRSEMKTLPKYFQIGKVMESPLDYYNERGTKKSKAKTLVDELLEDAQFQKYNKKKYAEALEKRKKKAYHKVAMKMKKLKKKKK
ncbi:deoxynucleotidyltransferase terminal-interacting protein 2 [Wyeomyia smithii]|uniref:deoxynucleotidyltransferase terminal-interacting protein 2 n=1 Tax=Wyeomyia smithii TaxID=174621 RepID=UPI002467FFE7|nr:deoxynucleotidyltransferase terminal-interacting protein 2 [Wyeomyia smithii]